MFHLDVVLGICLARGNAEHSETRTRRLLHDVVAAFLSIHGRCNILQQESMGRENIRILPISWLVPPTVVLLDIYTRCEFIHGGDKYVHWRHQLDLL